MSTTTPIYNTVEEAFGAEMGFPIAEASQTIMNAQRITCLML